MNKDVSLIMRRTVLTYTYILFTIFILKLCGLDYFGIDKSNPFILWLDNIFGIFTDGVKLNGGEANTVIAAAGDYENISIKKYIRVCGRGSVTVTINSLPTVVYDETVTDTQIPIVKNANIIIRRYA